MFRLFAIFRPFDVFRVPPLRRIASIPANALITADGVALMTLDGTYLLPEG